MNLAIFHRLTKLNSPFSFTVCMLNDTFLLIHQIKIRQTQKIYISPNFNPSKYTSYMVSQTISYRLGPSLSMLQHSQSQRHLHCISQISYNMGEASGSNMI